MQANFLIEKVFLSDRGCGKGGGDGGLGWEGGASFHDALSVSSAVLSLSRPLVLTGTSKTFLQTKQKSRQDSETPNKEGTC